MEPKVDDGAEPIVLRKIELDIDKLYPMPSKVDSSMCRDAFIKKMLKPFEKEVEVVIGKKVQEHGQEVVKKRKRADFNVENLLFNDNTNIEAKAQKKTISDEAKAAAIDITEIMQIRYDNLAEDMGRVCINFQLEQIKYRLLVLRELWPGDLKVLPFHMFGWSVTDYFRRFEQANTLYIDVMEMELSTAEMDCLKYRMDLGEILRLVDELLKDIKGNRDLCTNAMEEMRDSMVDIVDLLDKPRGTLVHEHEQMTMNLFQYRGGKRDSEADRKRKALKKQHIHMDYYEPIERRYRINWAYTIMEQGIIADELQCKAMSAELAKVENLIREDGYVFQCCNQKYYGMVEEYKHRINLIQEAFDTDYEAAENELQTTRNQLQKAKDDLKFHKEQVVMFHTKIARVHEIIAQEHEAEVQRIAALAEAAAAKTKEKGKGKGKGKGKPKK